MNINPSCAIRGSLPALPSLYCSYSGEENFLEQKMHQSFAANIPTKVICFPDGYSKNVKSHEHWDWTENEESGRQDPGGKRAEKEEGGC